MLSHLSPVTPTLSGLGRFILEELPVVSAFTSNLQQRAGILKNILLNTVPIENNF